MFRIIIFLLFIGSQLFGLNIAEYKQEEIIYIPTTNKKDSLLCKEGLLPPGPKCFTISEDGFFYVCDTKRGRIAVFDNNFVYQNEIKGENENLIIDLAKDILFVSNSVFYLTGGDRVIKIINKCKQYHFVTNKFRRFFVNDRNYIGLIDYFFFYYDNQLYAIDPLGNLLETTEARSVYRDLEAKNKPVYKNDKIKEYIYNNDVIFLDNKFFHPDFSIYLGYLKLINKNIKTLEKDLLQNYFLYQPLGTDAKRNNYWLAKEERNRANRVAIVFNANGELIDAFNVFDLSDIKLAYNGDVYTIALGDAGVSFYRIKNTWDPIE